MFLGCRPREVGVDSAGVWLGRGVRLRSGGASCWDAILVAVTALVILSAVIWASIASALLIWKDDCGVLVSVCYFCRLLGYSPRRTLKQRIGGP